MAVNTDTTGLDYEELEGLSDPGQRDCVVTNRIGVELAAVQRKLPGCVVVGLQLYSARTFHVKLPP